MKWSNTSWNRIQPIYDRIIKMPFINQLADGSLPLEQFQFYIQQDSIYLENFGRALALIAARCHDVQDILAYTRFAEGAIVVENALHESFFNDFKITKTQQISPACHHYIHFLKSTAALDQVEVAMAAVLPCFWIYKEVGDFIYANQTSKNNPYQKWIDTYAGEEFGLLVEQAIAICDRVAQNCSQSQLDKMHSAFYIASQLEYMFWDSASKLNSWEI
ncbi:thiaminase II [Leeuwenhoekiella sp. NPDC079379]|uniref:thiaminase II n=1 Tax=Leeuwenhoekiella sp. NPDC079379 TaxID=3364122 RepID=UPI0037C7777F